MSYFHNWNEFPEVQGLRSGASRCTISGEKMTIVKAEIKPGTQFDGRLHNHPSEQVVIMLEGRIKLRIEDEERWLEPGDVACIPEGLYHGATGVGESGARYLEMFSPIRVDYLIGYIGPSQLKFRE
jgi:quercetin dioxygenase-like cupin family protein